MNQSSINNNNASLERCFVLCMVHLKLRLQSSFESGGECILKALYIVLVERLKIEAAWKSAASRTCIQGPCMQNAHFFSVWVIVVDRSWVRVNIITGLKLSCVNEPEFVYCLDIQRWNSKIG